MPSGQLVLGFATVLAAGLLLTSALRGRTLSEVAHGITSPSVEEAQAALGASPSSGASSSAIGASSPNGGGFIGAGNRVVSYGRSDQGRDLQTLPGAPIVAPGEGTVLRIASDPSGFGPGYPIVTFTTGPYAGHGPMYLGHVDAALKAGVRFVAGQVLAHTSRTGHNAPPGWVEIGYAPGGVPGPFGQPAPF